MGVVHTLWAPPEWDCNCFPLPSEETEILTMEYVVSTLQSHIDTVTEADTTALGRALHVGHMLTLMQGADGQWPETFNARTGEPIGVGRTLAPVPLFRRMNAMLDSTEFDHTCEFAEAGGLRAVQANAVSF